MSQTFVPVIIYNICVTQLGHKKNQLNFASLSVAYKYHRKLAQFTCISIHQCSFKIQMFIKQSQISIRCSIGFYVNYLLPEMRKLFARKFN